MDCRGRTIFTVLIAGKLRVAARTDNGAGKLLLGVNHLSALRDNGIKLREWKRLDKPLSFQVAVVQKQESQQDSSSAAATSAVPSSSSLMATHTFRLDYAIETMAGPVHLRDRLCHFVEANLPEFLISSECLRSIGIDVDDLVTCLARHLQHRASATQCHHDYQRALGETDDDDIIASASPISSSSEHQPAHLSAIRR